MTEYAYSRNEDSISALTSMSTICASDSAMHTPVLVVGGFTYCPLWGRRGSPRRAGGATISGMSVSLSQAVQGAGYYPALANHVLRNAIGDEEVKAHFVHAETTFDSSEVRRHMTVLVLTPTRLLRVHMDDGAGHGIDPVHEASATVESAFLKRISNMALTHVVHEPESFREGQVPSELVLAVGWGVHSRIELEP